MGSPQIGRFAGKQLYSYGRPSGPEDGLDHCSGRANGLRLSSSSATLLWKGALQGRCRSASSHWNLRLRFIQKKGGKIRSQGTVHILGTPHITKDFSLEHKSPGRNLRDPPSWDPAHLRTA